MYRPLAGVLLLAMLFAAPAHAQVASTDTLTISLTPESPRPYQTVTVAPASNVIDLAAAKISVSKNGKLIESGSGAQRVPITVGGPGELTTISVSATVGGQTYTKQISLRPADVSLVIEPVSTTHPFYQGAPLVAPEGRIRVIAIPDIRSAPGTRLNPATLVYTWKWGDQLLTEQSGIGHSIITASAPVRYRDADISVTVTNADQSLVAAASTRIAPVDPVVRIYPADALAGPDFDTALTGSHTMDADEEAFRGVAYFFGTKPSLAWSVNSQAASADSEVTVRATGSGQGSATLSLSALTTDTHQSASARLPISFGASKIPNIFGF